MSEVLRLNVSMAGAPNFHPYCLPRDGFLGMYAERLPSKHSAVQICLARRLESSGRPYILHELLADWSDVLGEGGAEHHHLLLMGSRTENFLHVTPHVQLLQHLVALIQDKVLQVLQRKLL